MFGKRKQQIIEEQQEELKRLRLRLEQYRHRADRMEETIKAQVKATEETRYLIRRVAYRLKSENNRKLLTLFELLRRKIGRENCDSYIKKDSQPLHYDEFHGESTVFNEMKAVLEYRRVKEKGTLGQVRQFIKDIGVIQEAIEVENIVNRKI